MRVLFLDIAVVGLEGDERARDGVFAEVDFLMRAGGEVRRFVVGVADVDEESLVAG